MDPTKDFYCVDFMCSSGNMEIMVNEIPLIRYDKGGSLSTRMFINHLVDNGLNNFTVHMLPQTLSGFEPDSTFQVQVLHKRGEVEKVLSEVSFIFDYKKPVSVVNIGGSFSIIASPFKESLWRRNTLNELSEEHRINLSATFSKLLGLFRKKDIDQIMKEGSLKDAFFIERYYYDEQERLKHIRNVFESKFKDDSWEVAIYFDNHYKLRTYAGKKLYSFELNNSESPVEIIHSVKKMKLNIPVFFTYLDSEFKWVL